MNEQAMASVGPQRQKIKRNNNNNNNNNNKETTHKHSCLSNTPTNSHIITDP